MIRFRGFPDGSVVKNPSANAGNTGSIPGLGRSSGGGNGNPLQYSCLENSMDRGAWQTTVHGVTKSWTWQITEHAHTRVMRCMDMSWVRIQLGTGMNWSWGPNTVTAPPSLILWIHFFSSPCKLVSLLPLLLCTWNFLANNTGVSCHFLLQGIFLTQGLNPPLLCLLHCRQILYHWATKQ